MSNDAPSSLSPSLVPKQPTELSVPTSDFGKFQSLPANPSCSMRNQVSMSSTKSANQEELDEYREEISWLRIENATLKDQATKTAEKVSSWQQEMQSLQEDNKKIINALQDAKDRLQKWKLASEEFTDQSNLTQQKINNIAELAEALSQLANKSLARLAPAKI